MLSDFPADWRILPLEDCMAALIDYRGKSPQKTPFGIPLITAKVVKGGHINEPDEFIAADAFDAWMRRGMPEPGDVVMTTEAPLGEVAQLDGRRVALAQRLITLRGKSGFLDNTYLKYLMQSAFVQDQILARATGTTVLGIRQSELRRIHLCVPPISEQIAIAGILASLDRKIDLNRRMNETLESMARAIFKSWFVDFDPVRAKAEGRQPVGMDAETAALFPAGFTSSPAGHIPSGWRPCKWGDLATLEYGKSLRTYSDNGGSYRVYGTNGPIGWHSEPLCPRPGIIIGRKGAYRGVHFSSAPFFVIDTAFYLNPKLDLDLIWAFYEILALDINGMDSGSAIPSTSRDDFYALPVTLPSSGVVRALGQLIRPLFKKREANDSEAVTLAALRDALLPKLLSGEIRVRDAKVTVEAAL
ncbi:MAG: restriction endonuclease subunit S [Acidobacteria bacterium]|nr:restriction endonuclease subunit S [Acidobacteriota bacterium]